MECEQALPSDKSPNVFVAVTISSAMCYIISEDTHNEITEVEESDEVEAAIEMSAYSKLSPEHKQYFETDDTTADEKAYTEKSAEVKEAEIEESANVEEAEIEESSDFEETEIDQSAEVESAQIEEFVEEAEIEEFGGLEKAEIEESVEVEDSVDADKTVEAKEAEVEYTVGKKDLGNEEEWKEEDADKDDDYVVGDVEGEYDVEGGKHIYIANVDSQYDVAGQLDSINEVELAISEGSLFPN